MAGDFGAVSHTERFISKRATYSGIGHNVGPMHAKDNFVNCTWTFYSYTTNYLHYKLDSWLLCNARGASWLAIRYYILIRTLELTLQGQPGSNVMVQL